MFKKILLLTLFCIFSSSAYAAEQVITTHPATQSSQAGETFTLNVNYSTANPVDETLTGLGLRLHWDSSAISLNSISSVFSTGLFAQGTEENDTLDHDGNPSTDKFINISWVDFAGNWPNASNVTLYEASFTTSSPFATATTINFSASSTAAGYSLDASSLTVNPLVAVPNLVNLTQANAETSITSASLVLGTVTSQASSTIASGSVITQSPASGSTVAPGSSVNLTVSTGSAPVTVPDLSGQTQANAQSALVTAGLTLGNVTTQSSTTVPSGSVISQTPTAGSSVSAGSSINIVVSTGMPSVTVPDVTGQTQSAAETAITSAGLVVGSVSSQPSSTVPAGSVISQSITGGTSTSQGSSVNFVVSSGVGSTSTSSATPVPTMSIWGLIGLSIILGMFGSLRRKK